MYIDAVFVGVRDGAQVKKRAFYLALGMQLDGRRDVLGRWVAETEGAKFWLEFFTELKHRGCRSWRIPSRYAACSTRRTASSLSTPSSGRSPSIGAPSRTTMRSFYLVIQNAKCGWRAPKEWSSAIAHLVIVFEGRLPASGPVTPNF